MQNLRIDDLLGIWKSDKYTLTILQDKVVLVGNDKNISESVLMKHILTQTPNINTIQLSNNINIFQILNENEIRIKIKNPIDNEGFVNEIFRRVDFIDEFTFYRNIEVPNIKKYVAVRWYSPWEYATLLEICDYCVANQISGNNEKGKKIISDFVNKESLNTNKWIRINFYAEFYKDTQLKIISNIKEVLNK